MPPKILQLCAVDFTVYHFLLPLMRAQREWGFEVEFACSPGEYVEKIEAEGFKFRPIHIARSRNPLRLLRSYWDLKRLFKKVKYEVVHVHTPVAALIGRPAAKKSGVPVVLYTAHGFYFHDAMRPWVRKIYIAMERWAQRYADFLFSQSEEDRQAAIRYGIAPAEKTMTIGNGVDLNKFRPDLLTDEEKQSVRAEFGIKPGEGPVVTMMGRLVREKGYFELIEAWKEVSQKFPKARLLIIGDALPSDHDNAAEEIRAKVKSLGLEHSVIFAGLRKDVPQLLAASNIFVLPSWREGMPRSVIEAMASGLPVIASDIRGCREEVVDGVTGTLVAPRASQPLAEALIQLIASPEITKAFADAGLQRAVEHFSESAVIERQREVYRKLLKSDAK